jgi:hypothetical protein
MILGTGGKEAKAERGSRVRGGRVSQVEWQPYRRMRSRSRSLYYNVTLRQAYSERRQCYLLRDGSAGRQRICSRGIKESSQVFEYI